MKTACILGGNGFIGHHLARRLKREGYFVRVVDIKQYEYGSNDYADEVLLYDLRDYRNVESVLRLDSYPNDNINLDPIIIPFNYQPTPFTNHGSFDEVYTLACLMGGALYVFTGENDADIMGDSAVINLHVAKVLKEQKFKGKLFYSSSACIYPQEKQGQPNNRGLKETDAWPANPDSCYGIEKIFSERLFLAHQRNYNLNVRIARFHNIYGPEGQYLDPKAKAPAALCRKTIESNGIVEVLGDGKQTRSFLYIDDCIDAVRLLMQSEFDEPINIGSEEMVSINELAQMAIDLSGKNITIKNVPSNALGVRGRNSDNTLIETILGWKPKYSLKEGLTNTYHWISSQYEAN